MTDHEHSEAVVDAARWLAEQPAWSSPIIPALKAIHGLTPKEACEAIALANTFRMARRAHG